MKLRFKSQVGAERRVRDLERKIKQLDAAVKQLETERRMLACLAAKGPAFFNPLAAFSAENLRDRILQSLNMNPDGTFRAVNPRPA